MLFLFLPGWHNAWLGGGGILSRTHPGAYTGVTSTNIHCTFGLLSFCLKPRSCQLHRPHLRPAVVVNLLKEQSKNRDIRQVDNQCSSQVTYATDRFAPAYSYNTAFTLKALVEFCTRCNGVQLASVCTESSMMLLLARVHSSLRRGSHCGFRYIGSDGLDLHIRKSYCLNLTLCKL